jgi:integrase
VPRPPMLLETWGKIRRATIDGQPIAYTYYRDASGKRRQMQRNGRTEAAAERNLIVALKQKFEHSGEGELLTSESTVESLAEKYLEELELKKTVAGTFNTYRTSIRSKIVPGIGALRLREATVPRLDQFIKGMLVTPSSARTARTVLLQMFALAVRHGAVARNPAADTMPVPAKRNEVKVISLDDIHQMRQLFAEYDANHTSELAEISALLMATGCRIGEALALRWQDIDLGEGILRVTGTLSNDSDTGGLFRQEHPKSDAGRRGLRIPRTVVNMLTERRVAAIDDMVFPSATGTYRWPANTRRSWRQALEGSIYRGKTPRDFRKAVATHLDRQVGVKAAQKQLGHGSEDITTRFYVERQEDVADFAEVIQRLFESTG